MSNGIRLVVILFVIAIVFVSILAVLAAGGYTPKSYAEADGIRIENGAREGELKLQHERAMFDAEIYRTAKQDEAAAQAEAKKQSLAQQNEFEQKQQLQQLDDMAQRSQLERDLLAAQVTTYKRQAAIWEVVTMVVGAAVAITLVIVAAALAIRVSRTSAPATAPTRVYAMKTTSRPTGRVVSGRMPRRSGLRHGRS